MKLTEDQKSVNNFLKDLVKEITKKYKKDIDFIIIYGSAARGEFIIGVSDVDLVIQTAEIVEVVSEYVNLKKRGVNYG